MIGVQEDITSVPSTAGSNVKFNVTKLSHPLTAPPAIKCVAVVVFDKYVLPSIHVIGVQDMMLSVPGTACMIVKLIVAIESHKVTTLVNDADTLWNGTLLNDTPFHVNVAN